MPTSPSMRPMVVNTRQKIAVLASGLAIASTGFVTDSPAAAAAEARAGGDQPAAAAAPLGEPPDRLAGQADE